MSYNVETMNVQFLNQAFIDKIDQGLEKEAGAAMSAFVRQKLREDGFTRKIMQPQTITASDLDRGLDDQPRVIVEKEPDSVAASMSLSGKTEVRYFRGSRYEVPFYKISSQRFKKSKFELATYKTDIRQILQDNSVKDIQKQEDENFIAGLKAIQAEHRGGNAFITPTGDRVTDKLMNLVKVLVTDEQKPSKILMSHQLYLTMLREPATQLGDAVASEHFKSGSMEGFYGFDIVTSNKSSILSSDGVKKGDLVAVFAPEAYLGQFYSLQEPTVFLKAEADMIEFETYESIGIGIGNVKGFVLGSIEG